MPPQRKICSLDQLLKLRAQARDAGQTVVHCHGCFDIVHPGHIHHLQFARSLGEVLIVSVSSDSNVNKGVNRPLIPDDLRAGSLAALECVDWVYLNPDPTAVELLDRLRPDVFVKGKEYERNSDPRFLSERDTVTRHGGRVIFSSGDVVYSSTAIIGSLPSTDQFNTEKVLRLCQRYDLTASSLQTLVHRFRGQKVLVVGDSVLDRYHFCEATGVAGEAPMMALRSLETKTYDGGAAVVALHLAGLGADATLVSALADDDASAQAQMRLEAAGVAVEAPRYRRRLVEKHRYLVDATKLFKVDEGAISPIDSRTESHLAERTLQAASGAAAVILADFGYGLITAGLLDRILPELRKSVPVLTGDVSGRQSNLLRFTDVDLLCPTEREAREAMQDFGSGLGNVVARLLQHTRCRQAMITLGKQGLITFDWPDETARTTDGRLRSEYVPALSGRAIDPLGCGDALLATASLALACGASLPAAALLGSLAASVEVQELGNVPLTTARLIESIQDRDAALRPARLAS